MTTASTRGTHIVFRIHAGEGYGVISRQGTVPKPITDVMTMAQKNIAWVLAAIRRLHEEGGIVGTDNVIFRLGHLATITDELAVDMRLLINLGIPIYGEVNLTSNKGTGALVKRKESAWLHLVHRHVPVILGTDGPELMGTTLPDEYAEAGEMLYRFRHEDLAGSGKQNHAFTAGPAPVDDLHLVRSLLRRGRREGQAQEEPRRKRVTAAAIQELNDPTSEFSCVDRDSSTTARAAAPRPTGSSSGAGSRA